MRHLLATAVLGWAMAAGTGAAYGQYRDGYGAPDVRGPGRFEYSPVNRVLNHLERPGAMPRRDWKHMDSARRDLIRFQENWSRGRFDRGRLDGAIGHLNHLANSWELHPREREMFRQDVYQLREFRDRGGYRR